jgi:predicted pyridoxine 5'-phosphate oxidase superfamily flavin-nucleotide-binding protein
VSPPDGGGGAGGFLAFNQDELRAQTLAGQRASRSAIRSFMPEQHRAFFPLLPYIFTATLDGSGAPVASMLWGAPGFAHSPNPQTLRLDVLPDADDPAAIGVSAGQPIGLLGLDLSTRRRNRANGHVAAVDDGITVAIEQSFGNCAKYIQTRRAAPKARVHRGPHRAIEALSSLDDAAHHVIQAADTLFVASRSGGGIDRDGGLDVSHRGGRPGFVAVHGDTLIVPDFQGNRFFNTLGNLLGDRRAGLLFIDFATGGLLQLQGTVTIDWSASDTVVTGAERSWRIAIERGWRRPGALPFDWTFSDYAPTTLATGTAANNLPSR